MNEKLRLICGVTAARCHSGALPQRPGGHLFIAARNATGRAVPIEVFHVTSHGHVYA